MVAIFVFFKENLLNNDNRQNTQNTTTTHSTKSQSKRLAKAQIVVGKISSSGFVGKSLSLVVMHSVHPTT